MEKKDEEVIRRTFAIVKQDINFIFNELLALRKDLEVIKKELDDVKNIQEKWKTVPTHFQHISNTPFFPVENKEKNEGDKTYFKNSIGNKGVPTHLQHISNTSTSILRHIKTNFLQPKTFQGMQIQPAQQVQSRTLTQNLFQQEKENKGELEKIEHIVNNYKQILIKRFKALTKKEFEIFALIYSLQQNGLKISYKSLAEKTGLAPSSVRDLVNRLIIKGIPIQKETYHGKEVFLSIPNEILKISSLEALERLVNP